MKLRQTIAVFLITLAAGFIAFAQEKPFSINESPLPAPTGMVNDYAEVIDDATQAQIEQKLRDFKARTNPQVEIAVVTVKTTGERAIVEYSLAVARGWGIGSKETDNPSALLFIAVDDRKYFTQISKDLEDELPDGLIGQLQRQYLVPAFKQFNYTKGVNDTVDAFIKAIEERKSLPSATPKGTQRSNGGIPSTCYILICFIVIFIIFVLISRGSGGGKGGGGSNNDRWRSGGFGGNTSNSSAPIIFWGGGGGGSSSSDWGSSSSGGDSWGGFGGGGDFGGGGAGGDW
jgi:uncharacterized protein